MSKTLVKDRDVIVYRNEESYSHNAVVELLQNGEMVAVVQEQKRRKYKTHMDPSSKVVLLRSQDGGNTWDPKTKTVLVVGDSEAILDPAIKQLKDGTLILSYYKWRFGGDDEVPAGLHSAADTMIRFNGEHYAWRTGVYTKRSSDNGVSWEEEVRVPAPTGDDTGVSDPVIQVPNGDLFIPLFAMHPGESPRTIVMRSGDGGKSWGDPVTAAYDPLGYLAFEEPSLLYVPSGRMICMMRVHRRGEQEYGYFLYQADSYDLGKTWTTPRGTPMWGHPPHMVHLRSGRVLCVYGYRRKPYGVRACLSHDEGETWDIQNELILRADGIDADLGYPTSVQLADGTIFTVWYMGEAVADMGGTGHEFFAHASPLCYIGGTFLREK